MVDDGSTDGSARIAAARETADPRFRLVGQENQGLGPARNTGASHAKGDYLAFCDSDDIVPPRAYELLVGSLERTGSDFATGNVQRLEIGGMLTQSALHRSLATPAERTHVSRDHRLLGDRTAWNKVFSRAFWDRLDTPFPQGWYEDSPVMLPAHVSARAVDVIAEPVYQWRRRIDSISENRASAGNLAARMAVMEAVRDGLAAEYHDDFDRILLDVDLPILLESLPELPSGEQRELAAKTARLISALTPSVISTAPAPQRLCLTLLAGGRLDDLQQVLADQRDLGGLRTRSRGGRWYADYPFADDSYDLTDELRPKATIDHIRWEGTTLRLTGRTLLPGIPTESTRVFLRPSTAIGRVVQITVPATPLPGAPPGSFEASIDASRLKIMGRRRQVDWKLCVRLTGGGLTRKHSFGSARTALAAWPDPVRLPNGVTITPVGGTNRLQLRVTTP
jgi:CDP-glycerol glycerophosphotransferase